MNLTAIAGDSTESRQPPQSPTSGRQFIALALSAETGERRIHKREAEIAARIRISGTGSPIAQMIISRTNGLEEPFRFRWTRGAWPSSWKLVEIIQEEIPEDLDGYTPGDF